MQEFKKKNLSFHIRNTYRSDSMLRKYRRSLWLENAILCKRTSEQIIAQYAKTNTTKVVDPSPLFIIFIINLVNSLKYNFCQGILDIFKNYAIMFSAHIKFWTDLCFKYDFFFSLWVESEEWERRLSTVN